MFSCLISAISLCLKRETIYTPSTMIAVIDELIDLDQLPTLLMRTVFQSLVLHPCLKMSFIPRVLERLTKRQVWKYPKLWQGYVKCCEQIQPESFRVMLQLPPSQLTRALKMAPNLKEPLLAYAAYYENINWFWGVRERENWSGNFEWIMTVPQTFGFYCRKWRCDRVLGVQSFIWKWLYFAPCKTFWALNCQPNWSTCLFCCYKEIFVC